MTMTQKDIAKMQNAEQVKDQGDNENLDRKDGSGRIDVDNGLNQVSNGTQSTQREPGIAQVGNTSPGEEERH
ncbi:MAG: hypothetical protein ACXVBJ_02600 [Flavisolibacter sp.]